MKGIDLPFHADLPVSKIISGKRVSLYRCKNLKARKNSKGWSEEKKKRTQNTDFKEKHLGLYIQ